MMFEISLEKLYSFDVNVTIALSQLTYIQTIFHLTDKEASHWRRDAVHTCLYFLFPKIDDSLLNIFLRIIISIKFKLSNTRTLYTTLNCTFFFFFFFLHIIN